MRCALYSRNVFASDRNPAETAPTAASTLGGSATLRNSGMLNTSHHTATVRNESRTASAAPLRPKVSGDSVIATLNVNRMPPPM